MKNAKWIIRDRLFEKHYECSACGTEFNAIYDRCPNCKAKMDTKKVYDPRFVDELEMLDILGL